MQGFGTMTKIKILNHYLVILPLIVHSVTFL